MWGGALVVLEVEDTNFCESPSLSTKPLAWASVTSKLQLAGFAVLSQENCSATPRGLSGNCHAGSNGLCGRRTWKAWNSGGCWGQSCENLPCLKDGGSEDLIKNDGEGLLLGKVWVATN